MMKALCVPAANALALVVACSLLPFTHHSWPVNATGG